jgi:hypothetical protein
MICVSKCAHCKYHTFTDKSVLGHFKSFCEAYPDGDGIPAHVRDSELTAECAVGYKFEPTDIWKDYFAKQMNKE